MLPFVPEVVFKKISPPDAGFAYRARCVGFPSVSYAAAEKTRDRVSIRSLNLVRSAYQTVVYHHVYMIVHMKCI